MKKDKIKNKIKDRRKRRVRSKITGIAQKPRLSVFRSNKSSYIQLIDDVSGKTLVSASTKELPTGKQKITKQAEAEKLGELMAKKAAEKNIKTAVFDRGQYNYHGRVKAIAESARKAGLKI